MNDSCCENNTGYDVNKIDKREAADFDLGINLVWKQYSIQNREDIFCI